MENAAMRDLLIVFQHYFRSECSPMCYTNKIIFWVGQQDRLFSFLGKKNIISRAPHTTQITM